MAQMGRVFVAAGRSLESLLQNSPERVAAPQHSPSGSGFCRERCLGGRAANLMAWFSSFGANPLLHHRMHSSRRGNAGGHGRNRINWSADSARIPVGQNRRANGALAVGVCLLCEGITQRILSAKRPSPADIEKQRSPKIFRISLPNLVQAGRVQADSEVLILDSSVEARNGG